ncbi:MAG TPA: choice-of-anchor D domain-containing protein, partial [Verrucomicrobiae bacterium]
NLGVVDVGSSADFDFTIRNIGNTDLTGLGITITGSNAGEFSVTAKPVAPVTGPNGSTFFTLHFAPVTGGPKSAVLHIANNDWNHNPFDIALTGSAIANFSPTLTRANATVIVPVNTPATNSGTFADVDGDTVTLTASVGAITQGAGTWIWNYTPGNLGPQTVTITANDGRPSGTNAVTFTLTATDATPPAAAFVPVTPDPRPNAVGTIALNFSENVSGVNASDFILTRNGSPVSLAGVVVTAISGSSYTLDLATFTATPGSYVITLHAAGSGIVDDSANLLSVDASDAFNVASSSGTVSGGNLSINNAPNAGNLGLTLRLVTVGGTNYIEIRDANNALAAGPGATQVDGNTIRVPLADVTGELQLNGGPGDDHFVIDATAGCVLPPGGTTVNGGGQSGSGDTLQVLGGFSSVHYDANTPGAGVVSTDCGDVNFTGLEPVDFTSATLVDLAINIDPLNQFAGTVTTTLSAMPGAGNEGNTRAGLSGGLELFDFGALTGTLTITGDSAEVDTMVLQGVGTNFAGHLVFAAQAADSVLFTNGVLILRTGKNFDVTAGSVTVGAATVSGGTIAFHGGSIAMNIGGVAPGAGVNQYSR